MASHSCGLLGHGHDLLVSQHTEHAPHPATDGDNGDGDGDFDGYGDGSVLADLLRIIPFLFPKEVCKLSSMCKTVLAVADSDHVWAHKVPIYLGPDVAPAYLISEKKKIKKTYFHLRSDMPQQLWSDPAIAQGSYFIPARRIDITWIGHQNYWQWLPQPGSWFGESACLKNVCWLEMVADTKGIVFRPGVYVASFRIMLINPTGFRNHPVRLRLDTSDGQRAEAERFLEGDQFRCGTVAPLRPVGGGWLDLDIGEFTVESEMPLTVWLKLTEIEGVGWKSGLVIDCIKIQLSSDIYV